jgi:hypothetical protein
MKTDNAKQSLKQHISGPLSVQWWITEVHGLSKSATQPHQFRNFAVFFTNQYFAHFFL